MFIENKPIKNSIKNLSSKIKNLVDKIMDKYAKTEDLSDDEYGDIPELIYSD